MDNVVWMIIAVAVAILLIAAVVFIARQSRTKKRRVEAERIREQVRDETAKLERREALADETAARARAAKAEAEAKAAEAARLEERAAPHQSEVTASREELNKRWEHADRLNPAARTDNGTAEDTWTTAAGQPAASSRLDEPTPTRREAT
jgi:DNA anti-recombination protein RmuC